MSEKLETEFHKIWKLSKEESAKKQKEIEEGELRPIMVMDEENIPYKDLVVSIHSEYLEQHPDCFSAMKMLSSRNLKTGKIKSVFTEEFDVNDSEIPNKKVFERSKEITIEECEIELKIFTDLCRNLWWCDIKILDYSDCNSCEEVIRKLEKGDF